MAACRLVLLKRRRQAEARPYARWAVAACTVVLLGPMSRIAPLAPLASADAPPNLRFQASLPAPQGTGCSAAERRDALQTMQQDVLKAVPRELPSLARARAPGGPLAGWGLSHGYVVLAGSGAMALDNIAARDPVPQLLLYEPSPSSEPADWLDFDGPDDPYRLVGWAYVAPYKEGSPPPQRRCVAPSEWFVHEAGWHLKDGSMRFTPGAVREPPRPPGLAVHMWHPQVWDLHVWRADDGVPRVAFANPGARAGGLQLPPEAFFRVSGAERRPVEPDSARR